MAVRKQGWQIIKYDMVQSAKKKMKNMYEKVE